MLQAAHACGKLCMEAFVLKRVGRKLFTGVLCALMLASLGACGSMMSIGVGLDNNHNPYWDSTYYLHNGVWQGKYVWYEDAWHYLGYGTPYLYDPWRVDDPYYYD